MKIRIAILILLVFTFFSCKKEKELTTNTTEPYAYLKKGFENPPESTKPGIYWYFLSGHISKEGITKDLEAMRDVGIGEVFIGDIFYTPSTTNRYGLSYDTPMGDTPSLSKKWWDCMRHAISEGTRLGVNISFFNSPGWSQSGGPWIKEEEAMRYLTYSETLVSGGKNITLNLAKPKTFFQDVSVLAYPYKEKIIPKTTIKVINGSTSSVSNLLDQNTSTITTFGNKEKEPVLLEISFDESITARSLTLSPTKMHFKANIEVQAFEDGAFKSIKKISFDRASSLLGRGPIPNADMIIALDHIPSKKFRIQIDNVPANFELSGIHISEAYKIEHAHEKWLNKMANRGVPSWEVFQWKTPKYQSQKGVLNTNEIINLTEYLDGDVLKWKNVPQGTWKILRIGMTPTGQTNRPATPAARGLEVDKLSKKALRSHFDAYMGKMIKSMTPTERKSLKRIIADSYETGPQNWTDDMKTSFEQVYHYDPTPWLATLTGSIVNSAEESDRFLWDMRRLIADKVADEYVLGLQAICKEYGVSMWLENYGHFGFPSEFLKYGGRADEIGGEFWVHRQGPESMLAASASHIYGKNRVYAESYTSREVPYSVNPAQLKKSGDWSYTQGINQGILHVYIHQPYADKFPGMNAWFGTEFNRNNTWFAQSKEWITYLRRNYFLLQQGKHVADVCFYIGEESPKMKGWVDRKLSSGYQYDFINAEIILQQTTVQNGKLVLQSGASYGALVLPPWNTMRPEVLAKLKQLVEQGATLIGSPPEKSPSLQNYPKCDDEVKQYVQELWDTTLPDSKDFFHNKLGKGNVYSNGNINTILNKHEIYKDLIFPYALNIKWVHRKLQDADIYFITNQDDKNIVFDASFRVADKSPELWSALDATSRKLPIYSNEKGRTVVPLSLNVGESYFIVFKNKGHGQKKNLSKKQNFKIPKTIKQLHGLWDIQFKNKWLKTDFTIQKQPLFDWVTSTDERIKYFSGTATYTTTFELTEDEAKQSLYIDFENVNTIASLKLNGQELGTIWTRPYRIPITAAIKSGTNLLEIDVTNNWVNQMLWQNKKPRNKRDTWELVHALEKMPNNGVMSSGIYGKVFILKDE